MAKFKVYELAKELNKSSKEVVAFLQEKGIEVKAAQSSVDDAAAELVKKHFGGQSEVKTVEEPKAEMQKSDAVKKDTLATEKSTADEGKAEEQPKKKKNIIFVSNPQNSKMPGGQKNAVKNNNQKTNNKPNNNKPNNNKPVQESKPTPKPIQLGPNQMINKSTGKVMEMLPPKKPEIVEEVKEVKQPIRVVKRFETAKGLPGLEEETVENEND